MRHIPQRVANPALPDHLRTVETALDWAIKSGAYEYEGDFPLEVSDYMDLLAFIEDSEELVEEATESGDDHKAWELHEQAGRAQSIVNNAGAYIDRMLQYEKLDEVELYRVITVTGREAIRWDDIGVYWAYDRYCARAHWGGSNKGRDVLLAGVVRPENIDWKGGFVSYTIYGDDECEIRVDAGAPILITEIDGEELEEPIHATA